MIIKITFSPGGVDFLIETHGLLIPFLFIAFHACLALIQFQKLLAILPGSSLSAIRRTLLFQVIDTETNFFHLWPQNQS